MVCYILLPETEAQQLSAKTSYFPLSLQTSKVNKKNNLVDQGATSSSRFCGIFERATFPIGRGDTVMMPKVKLQTQKEILPIPAFLEHGRIRRDTQFGNVEKSRWEDKWRFTLSKVYLPTIFPNICPHLELRVMVDRIGKPRRIDDQS